MAKRKTHKGLTKRIKVTATGKISYRRAFAGHLMSGKPASRRRALRRPGILQNPSIAQRIREAVGEDGK